VSISILNTVNAQLANLMHIPPQVTHAAHNLVNSICMFTEQVLNDSTDTSLAESSQYANTNPADSMTKIPQLSKSQLNQKSPQIAFNYQNPKKLVKPLHQMLNELQQAERIAQHSMAPKNIATPSRVGKPQSAAEKFINTLDNLVNKANQAAEKIETAESQLQNIGRNATELANLALPYIDTLSKIINPVLSIGGAAITGALDGSAKNGLSGAITQAISSSARETIHFMDKNKGKLLNPQHNRSTAHHYSNHPLAKAAASALLKREEMSNNIANSDQQQLSKRFTL